MPEYFRETEPNIVAIVVGLVSGYLALGALLFCLLYFICSADFAQSFCKYWCFCVLPILLLCGNDSSVCDGSNALV